jgi:hypothetical protein
VKDVCALADGDVQPRELSMAKEPDEGQALDRVAERLAARYPQMQPDTIRSLVFQTHQQFEGSPIRDYVPLLVERAVRESLDQAASHVQV